MTLQTTTHNYLRVLVILQSVMIIYTNCIFLHKVLLKRHLCFRRCFSRPMQTSLMLFVNTLPLLCNQQTQSCQPGRPPCFATADPPDNLLALTAMSYSLRGISGSNKSSCCLCVFQPHLTSRMWALTPRGFRSGHGNLTEKKSISVLSKNGKEGEEEEYDTDSYSPSFSLQSRDGVLLSHSLKLCLLYRDRKCQTIMNSEVIQKKPS